MLGAIQSYFNEVVEVIDPFVLVEINKAPPFTSQLTLAGYYFFFTGQSGREGAIGAYVKESFPASAFSVNFPHAERVELTL